MKECPGHFGHIELEQPVYHVGYVELTMKALACICHHCGKLKLQRNTHKFKQVESIKRKPKNRLNLLYKYSRDIKDCGTKNKEGDGFENGCGRKSPKLKRKSLEIIATYEQEEDEMQDTQRNIMAVQALEILERVRPEDCEVLGFNNQRGRPEWMIIKRLPVAPPCVSPSVEMMNNQRSEDDLTTQYLSIIRQNNALINQRGAAHHTI